MGNKAVFTLAGFLFLRTSAALRAKFAALSVKSFRNIAYTMTSSVFHGFMDSSPTWQLADAKNQLADESIRRHRTQLAKLLTAEI